MVDDDVVDDYMAWHAGTSEKPGVPDDCLFKYSKRRVHYDIFTQHEMSLAINRHHKPCKTQDKLTTCSVAEWLGSWGPFFESPETFRAHLGLQCSCIFKLRGSNEGVSRHESLQLLSFLFPFLQMKRPTLQIKRVGVVRMAFRARKVFGTFRETGS